MTPDELKKLLAPDVFECRNCKKPYGTPYAAAQCEVIEKMQQEKVQKQTEEKEKQEKKEAAKLEKMLEDNLL